MPQRAERDPLASAVAPSEIFVGVGFGAVTTELTSIPNVGPAVALKLRRLGIAQPDDLRGCDPEELFSRLCVLEDRRHDPCLLDTFAAAVAFANGGPARPWWEFSRERKARVRG